MLIVDSLIISGVRFVLTRLVEAVEAEMFDETGLREELLAAQMQLELGEIDEEQFAGIEEVVLRGLREIRERKRADSVASPRTTDRFVVDAIEADSGDADSG